ncbi:hypothetical protein ACFVHT_23895 [Bacillus subtilis]
MDVPSKIPLDTEAGVISELFVEHAFEDVLSRSDDREQMAAVGAVAAALGLSGPSAGMAVMSSEGGRSQWCESGSCWEIYRCLLCCGTGRSGRGRALEWWASDGPTEHSLQSLYWTRMRG